METTRKEEVKPKESEETIDVDIQQLRDTLVAEERKKEELVRRREQEQRRGEKVKEMRQVIGTEVGEQTDMSQTLAYIVAYLTFLEEKIDSQQNQLDEITVGLRTIANIVKEIQTYVSTAPVEPESQVAFTTSCMGGEAKQWVLVEANAAGFEDIGEWAKTLMLKQFLAKTRDRLLDETTTDKAFDQLTSIGQKHWTKVEALSRKVDRLLQVPGLNLQDSQELYNYSRALPEPIRGHLVTEAKSGKYNYRQFRDLALQREQMTSQVKNSYAAVVKSGGGGGRQYNGKRVLWRQKRQDHTLVVFDDDTVEKWPNEENDNNSDSGKGEVTTVVANKGGPPRTGGKKQRAFPWHPDIDDGKPWVEMGMTRKT
ncbi:hypothetical protein CBR_g52450 [Chara braunii]|uniref:Uncharacterized protein n=1 Tax=Chara braunii TaxID=69332 RepID=A0A388MA98_CHABU|nr:hypothetical protein CBR_g52450 [Chara braunii]|eukprot:GBG91494.1 hypothetical protein CBR_g52450 [Chara braunii]